MTDVPTPEETGFENEGDTPRERIETAIELLDEHVDGLTRRQAEVFIARHVRGSGSRPTQRALDAAGIGPDTNAAQFMGDGEDREGSS